MRGRAGTRRTVGLAALALSGAVALSGCQRGAESAAATYEPATVGAVGDLGTAEVTVTSQAADKIGLRTAVAAGAEGATVVPYAALIYDSAGKTWVYVNSEGLTFSRTEVAVDHIDGGQVFLAGGIDPGTRVVTVGSTEVYGTELGISGGH